MRRFRSALLLTALCAAASCPPADGTAAEAAPVIYAETLTGSLTWVAEADGGVTPHLAGTSPWAETQRPSLAARDLVLLVPTGTSWEGVEIVPLATRRETAPAALALGSATVSTSGLAVSSARHPLTDDVFPASWGEYAGRQTWRGFQLALVRVYPLRAVRDAEGAWTEVEVLERYAVRPVLAAASRDADAAQRERLVPGERARAEAVLAARVANPEALSGYARVDGTVVSDQDGDFAPTATPSLSGSAVSYLIVTREALATPFQRLADHRTSLGMPAVVKTVEWIEANYRHGADVQETIRIFLRDAYARWGVEYVLLGGDTDVLPARFATSSLLPTGSMEVPADLYFACLDGNWNADGDYRYGESYYSATYPGDDADFADELLVGRAPVSLSSEADAFVDKVIAYERQLAGTAWPNRMLFAADVLYPQDFDLGDLVSLDGATFAEQIIANSLTPCTSVTTSRLYENYPTYPGALRLTKTAFTDSVNSGHFGLVNQIGHGFFFNMELGDENFVVSDADLLTNDGHNFLLYALNCASAAFDYACLLERFVKNPHGGSIASIGSSREAFPYTASNYQDEFFATLFCRGSHRLGDLMSLSRLPMLANTFYETFDRWTFLNYTLLGDPGTPIWNGSPRSAAVTAPNALVAGTQTVPIAVTAGGAPVAGALVCLSMSGVDFAWGLTDTLGLLSLPFTPVGTGTARLTVSGAGLAVDERDIPVTNVGAYIACSSATIVDSGTGGTTGNGDGRMDAGETVAVWMTFRDAGTGGAMKCTATLSGGPDGITILDATANVGNVPSGGIKAATEPFLLYVAPTVSDGTLANFAVLVVAQTGGSWTSEWNSVAYAPELAATALSWSDATYGDGNNVQANGERITLTLRLKNYGAGLSGPLTGVLRTADPAVTLYDSLGSWTDLSLLGDGVNAPAFSLTEADVATDHACWLLITDQYGRALRHDFHLAVPPQPSSVVTNGRLGPDVIALTWSPLTTAGVRGYHVYRSQSASGPFSRVNADLIEQTSYYRDAGLQLLTQYFYMVGAVDSSLVEGPPSAVVAQSTAPPELTGFPLPVAVETSSHCAVGDVNGDGLLEIVVGADKVYVWTADGGELRDGDNNAQTHGPLTPIIGNFGPAGITLAELDGAPGLEIIASERLTYTIYIFKSDGSNLAGWPRVIAGKWNWTTPAVGDVDGDGSVEIVFNDINATTHVFNVDGTELLDGDQNPATIGVFLVRPESPNEYGVSSPALADLDGDGRSDIIFGSKDSNSPNFLYAYRYDRQPVPGFPFPTGATGLIKCSPSVGDLDQDGNPEIVFVSEADSLYVLRRDGACYPGFPLSMVANSGTSCPSPALADFDGDGVLEIVVVSTLSSASAAIRVYSADWAAGTSGLLLPGWPQNMPGNSESSPVVGDIDGDGGLDIVHGIGGGDATSPNNLYAFSATGEAIPGFPVTLGGPIRPAAVLCDLDGDGNVNLVYNGWDLQVHVWNMPFAYDKNRMPWPTFRGRMTRDGVFGRISLTAVPEGGVPSVCTLAPNYPNPFNPATTIRLWVPGATGTQTDVRLRVYDLQGRLVRTLHEGATAAGWNTWLWDGRDHAGRLQASGAYFLRAQADGQATSRKMLLVK